MEYDAGYLDRDEQSWMADVHNLHLEGDTLHVEQRQGRERTPSVRRWTACVLGAIPTLDVVMLGRGTERLAFDLRSRRLLSGFLSTLETTIEDVAPACVPDPSNVHGWIARVLGAHAQIARREVSPTGTAGGAIVWDEAKGWPLGGPGHTFTRGSLSDETQIDVFRDENATLWHVMVRCRSPGVEYGWNVKWPAKIHVAGHPHAGELARFRLLVRVALASGAPLPAWEEATRQLAAIEEACAHGHGALR